MGDDQNLKINQLIMRKNFHSIDKDSGKGVDHKVEGDLELFLEMVCSFYSINKKLQIEIK